MSEIQSISQNNYILHNIDAKKLYVQEPLFTANSGDAVYVGWRPDETVLWEGSANITSTTSYKTSESVANFDRIAVYGETWNNWSPVKWGEICASDLVQASLDTSYLGSNGGAIRFVQIMFNFTNSGFTIPQCQLFSITGNGTQAGTPSNTIIRKVVGINRKENA